MHFEGFMGSMELTETMLKICRKGMEGHSIPLSQVVSVIIMKPGLTSNGLIHIQTVTSLGNSTIKTKYDYGTDLNTVFFTRSSYRDALAFKESIESALAKPIQNQDSGMRSDLTTQLSELKALVDQGLITEDDYNKKKQLLLGL